MRFIFQFLGILFFLIWITIGAALLIGLFVLFTAKPWQSLPNLGGLMSGGGLSGLSAMMGQAGALGEVAQKLQTGQNPKEVFNSLPKSQQDCLYKELGSKTVNDAFAGKLEPTPDLAIKTMKCLNLK